MTANASKYYRYKKQMPLPEKTIIKYPNMIENQGMGCGCKWVDGGTSVPILCGQFYVIDQYNINGLL